MLVDPIYEVNPATALVDLVTKIILHPLSRYVNSLQNEMYQRDKEFLASLKYPKWPPGGLKIAVWVWKGVYP